MNLGLPELIAIFVLALILFGPKKLPEIGKTLGKTMREFRKAADDLKQSLEQEIDAESAKEDLRKIKDEMKGITDEVVEVKSLDSDRPIPEQTAGR